MEEEQGYRAEYSKSNRASCKGCKEKIEKEVLRLAVMVQSPHFDGKIPNWYHYSCFFKKQRPASVGDIAHFENLRWEDQEKITKKLESSDVVDTGKRKAELKDYTAEYAKSSRSICRHCEEKILKGDVRIAKKDYDSDNARRYGPLDRWHHVDCFVKIRQELEFYDGGEKLPGFFTLSSEDQENVKTKIRKIEEGQKRKAETQREDASKKQKVDDVEQKKMKEQNDLLFKYRDHVKRNLKKAEMQALLEENNYMFPAGVDKTLDVIADGMAFGALTRCTVCNHGQLRFASGIGYVCTGSITDWTKCQAVNKAPKRVPFVIPQEFKEEYAFLNKYTCKIQDRIIKTTVASSQDSVNGSQPSTSKSEGKPLQGWTFVLAGELSKDIKKKVKELGGSVTSSVSKSTAAVIATKEMLDGKENAIRKAEKYGIQVVPVEFVEEAKGRGAVNLIQKLNMAPWGEDPLGRLIDPDKPKGKSSASMSEQGSKKFLKSLPEKVKVRLKGGAAVDPESGLEDKAHVIKRRGLLMTSVLCMVDAARGTNSYYKLQALEGDKHNRFWVFRSWGRIGTTIGNTKLEELENKEECTSHFKSLYEEKTGNIWGDSNFQKLPNRFYPMDIDFGQQEEKMSNLKDAMKVSKSKLPLAVQKLICLIFDVDRMKQALVEFEIDLKKMPLGKLSKRQIEDAYKVLTEAQNLVSSDEDAEAKPGKLLDCSNRFYTLIPHDFGMKKPPLLDNEEYITSKVEMLDNLLEIEVAYGLLKSEDTEISDPIDSNYSKLQTKIEPLDKSADEYSLITEYVKNTHAPTHSNYKLSIKDIFKIDRKGERKKYKPFKTLPNRHLLWHGSRVTNYAGILSQGLRIAPPEAPVTGYMFGKGIYFADMVSKSANYCMTNYSNPTGLLLLCEVALGNMYERPHSEYIEKLPSGKHSTKGMGCTRPNPEQAKVVDGVTVPLGTPVPADAQNTSLLYNEYIVYDTAQVNMKYLIKVNFKY